MSAHRVVYVIACAAPPVLQLVDFVGMLAERGWDSYVILTPTAATWVDFDELATISGNPVRVEQRTPATQDALPPATALIAAPLTFNSLNKWAVGISDNLAVGLLNEALGLRLPIIAAPWAKEALRQHPAYEANALRLSAAGVTLVEQDAITSEPAAGNPRLDWGAILTNVQAVFKR